ncbi:MAG TPA: hypothetical protein VMY18_03020 [Acidobacteriota bacterium]|nr:hypothetical protein [Acidobacteriota bacterium]
MWITRKLGYNRDDKRGTTFVSFIKPLQLLCQRFPLKTVLEFGPGYSTEILFQNSSATIISLETNLLWHLKYRKRFDSERVRVLFGWPGKDLVELGGEGPYSLIFIDAGDRVSIMKGVFNVVHPNGMVFLHDAHRAEYEPGIHLYPHRYFPERHSCILFKSKNLRDAVEKEIPPDYSCICRECSSADRTAYFSRLAGSAP